MNKSSNTNTTSKTAKEVLEVPGQYARPFSMEPLKGIKSMMNPLVSYLEEKQKAYNSSVFRVHPGIRSVACLDHISAEFYFNAPTNLLARENKRRFGPIAVRSKLLGEACPALTSTGTQHEKSRGVTDDILAARADFLSKAFEKVSEGLFAKWSKAGEVGLYDALFECTSNTLYEWILGIDMPFDKSETWSEHILTAETDTLLTQILGKFMMPRCPRKALTVYQEMQELVKSSPLFPEFLKMAEKHGIDPETMPSFLIFLCSLNGSGAPRRSLLYTVAKINTMPQLKQKIQTELKGANESEIMTNPFLDNVYFEAMRLNTRPRIFFKKAQCDFEMPAANGKYYQIREGDLLMIPAIIIHRDPTVFENADDFSPQRFADNPKLKDKVFGQATSPNAQNGYGCAARKTGQAAWLWKMLLIKLLTQCSFDLNVQLYLI